MSIAGNEPRGTFLPVKMLNWGFGIITNVGLGFLNVGYYGVY